MKRLVLWLPLDLHIDIKKLAAQYNMPMCKYIMQALVPKVLHDKKLNE